MMHRCCSGTAQDHMMGPCTCGMFHGQANSFSMLFSMPNNHHKPYEYDDNNEMYSSYTTHHQSSSSVDCTLSLGTPSTRFTEDEEKRSRHERRSSVSNLCWDLLQSKNTSHHHHHHNHHSHSKSTNRGNNNNSNISSSNNDPLLARRCANCDTTSTPLWRNGPRGPKSLCNACGIRFKKEERRASAAAAAPAVASGGMMDSAQMYGHHHGSSWYGHPQSQKMQQCLSPASAMGGEYRFVDDSDRESENGIPFLSWRLNVTDRTSLVHDFTR